MQDGQTGGHVNGTPVISSALSRDRNDVVERACLEDAVRTPLPYERNGQALPEPLRYRCDPPTLLKDWTHPCGLDAEGAFSVQMSRRDDKSPVEPGSRTAGGLSLFPVQVR